MAHLLGCFLIVCVAIWLACGPRASAAAVAYGKPVALAPHPRGTSSYRF
jgi:hypothetical protein